MKNITITSTHNPKNHATNQVTQVIEVGKASNLTLGTVGPKYETPNRPNSSWGRYKN